MRFAPDGTKGNVAQAEPMRAEMSSALSLLWQAHKYARELGRNLWDFAVEIRSLRAIGLTNSDFRWLLCHGYVEHADEITFNGQDGRTFRPVGNLTLTKRSCFVLTEVGVSVAAKECKSGKPTNGIKNGDPENDNGRLQDIPRWDRDRHELRFGDAVIKQFKLPAVNQEAILAAFQEESWPPRIDDPLPPQNEKDPKRRLHDTITALNRNQKKRLIRFLGDGSGQGVRWELARRARRNGA